MQFSMKPSSRQLDNAIFLEQRNSSPQGKWLSTVFFYAIHERKNTRKSLIVRYLHRVGIEPTTQ